MRKYFIAGIYSIKSDVTEPKHLAHSPKKLARKQRIELLWNQKGSKKARFL
jgi:hypothetical protein